jgi:pimeloyl-ACP methyl ester carboxylesterase
VTAPRSGGMRGEGATSAFATADDGTRLFVRMSRGEQSSATCAILCDGIACDGFIWKYLWDDLSQSTDPPQAGRREHQAMPVVHWNYRGHGRSAMPTDPDRVDIPTHAADLMAVRRFAGSGPCVLIGHSMGCQVVLEELRQHREGVRGLVLMCGSYGRVTKTFRGVPILEMILPKMIAAVKKNESFVRALWERIPSDMALKLALKAGDLDPEHFNVEDMRPYVTHMRSLDLPLFLRMLSAAGEHSAEDLLPTVDVPVLVVAGERDTFTPLFLAESMAKAMPKAELFVVKNGSHVAPLEQHDLVGEKVRSFLRELV